MYIPVYTQPLLSYSYEWYNIKYGRKRIGKNTESPGEQTPAFDAENFEKPEEGFHGHYGQYYKIIIPVHLKTFFHFVCRRSCR